MENVTNDTLDVKSLFKQILRNWYWFVISCVVCCSVGAIYFLSSPIIYMVEARIQVRPGEETTFMPGAGVIQAASLNRSIEIGDEKALISSRDIFSRAISELGIQTAYATKSFLRWTEVTRRNSDVVVVADEATLDKLNEVVTVYVKPRKHDVQVTIKRRHHATEKHILPNLNEPFMTDCGFAIQARGELKTGKQYRLKVTSTDIATLIMAEKAKCIIPPKTRTILDLKLETDRPSEGRELIEKQIEIYNRLTVDNRQQLATNATDFIDERLETLAEVKKSSARAHIDKEVLDQLGLFLSQKREEKALTLRAPAMPAIEVIKAHVSSDIVAPHLSMIALLSLLLGLLIPFAVIFSIVAFSGKIYGRKQFEQLIKVPYLGDVLEDKTDGAMAVGEGVNTEAAERVRLLRMNILRQLGDNKVVMVTSCEQGEGASYCAANLAMSLSLLDKKVILVDLNLRQPAAAQYFAKSGDKGVTDYLNGAAELEKLILLADNNKQLAILPAGKMPANPSELLQRERLEQLFAQLNKQYDYIIVDAAPVMALSDSFLANRVCAMTLIVANQNSLSKDKVEFINQCAAQQRLNNIAVVLNDVK